jgi:hypothetical protein
MRAAGHVLGLLLLLASCVGCDQTEQPKKSPYEVGYNDGVWAAQAQKSKGRTPDLKQTLDGRSDLAADAGFEPGDERDNYRAGFAVGYNAEFEVQP